MSASLHIRRVTTNADFRLFYQFVWTVYADDPHWIPPLVSMRREMFDRQHNPAWEYLEGEYFLALRGEQVVGTVAAFINHRHNEYHHEQVGWFGAFEVFDDADAAELLLKTAVEWVRARGYNVIRGPQTLTTHEEVGLLVDGFAPPVFLMPYHKPYYQQFIETAGFTRYLDFYSYYYDWEMTAQTGSETRISRLADYVSKRAHAHVRPINPKNLQDDFRQFKEIYNDAWAHNPNFVPLTDRELTALVKSLKMIFDPSLAAFAEVDGELAGFIILIPDLNEALKTVRPRPQIPEFFSLAQMAWRWKVHPKVKGFRVPLLGVREKYRNIGVDLLMLDYIMKRLHHTPYTQLDAGWILENNPGMRRVLENSLGMKIHRTYRMYEKSID